MCVMLPGDIRCRLHLNLREGPCCLSDPAGIRLLVDGQGYFRLSFGTMLFLSFFREKSLKAQVKR
jgi:hypothetical protein